MTIRTCDSGEEKSFRGVARMANKGRQSVRKPATKLPHLRKKMRSITPQDRTRGKKRGP
jgi:hypothetical protein